MVQSLLAGAFGAHLDGKYVADFGIIPMAPAQIISSVGNASGMGAAMALLNVKDREKIRHAIDQVEKIETALEPKFQDYFVDAMKFPTAEAASKDAGRRRRRKRS